MGCMLRGQGEDFLNRLASGHLLRGDAVRLDLCRVLRWSSLYIYISTHAQTPWGTSSWQALRYGTYAVFAGEILFESTLLGASPPCGRCVVNRAPCSQGKCFLNRHSLGHLLMADTVLWDVRCVIKESIFSDRHSFWHLFMVDAVLWDVRCVLDQSIF